jgi:hypothetical protein
VGIGVGSGVGVAVGAVAADPVADVCEGAGLGDVAGGAEGIAVCAAAGCVMQHATRAASAASGGFIL